MLVGIDADQRLEQRGGQLESERDKTDLSEVERVGILEDRIDRRQQRLHHVVEAVAHAQRREDGEGGVIDIAGGVDR